MRLSWLRCRCTWCETAEFQTLRLLRKLDQIEVKLDLLIQKGTIMDINFAELTAQVERNTSVDDSAVLAIQGLTASVTDLQKQIADLIANGGDVTAIQAAVDAYAVALAASSDKLALAIPLNT